MVSVLLLPEDFHRCDTISDGGGTDHLRFVGSPTIPNTCCRTSAGMRASYAQPVECETADYTLRGRDQTSSDGSDTDLATLIISPAMGGYQPGRERRYETIRRRLKRS